LPNCEELASLYEFIIPDSKAATSQADLVLEELKEKKHTACFLLVLSKPNVLFFLISIA
jgi:hypothetical protein